MANGSNSNTDSPPTACVACYGRLRFFGPRLRYEYYRCVKCGSVQLNPLPKREELEAAYRKDYATGGHCRSHRDESVGAAQPYYNAILAALKEWSAEGNLLEVGAGWGGLCQTLLAEGFDYEGVDLSEDMVSHCQSLGLPVTHGDVWSVDSSPRNALVLSAVFEHLVHHDAWLDRAHNLLIPGGLFVSMQPTALFASFMGQVLRLGVRRFPLPQLHQVFCPPWHTVLFSIEGMRQLMNRHGFELLEVRRGPQAHGSGLTGTAQRFLGALNRAGWPLFGERWPLVISHIFVFRKLEIRQP